MSWLQLLYHEDSALAWFFGKKKKKSAGPPIKFMPSGEMPELDDNMKELYNQTKLSVMAALSHRAEAMTLQLSGAGVSVQYLIDGVPHPAPGIDADTGRTMMAMLKAVAGLDLNQPKPVDKGSFEIFFQQKKYAVELVDQVAKNGETLQMKFDDGAPSPGNLEEAGMRPGMIQQLKDQLEEPGFFLVAGPRNSGLTTTFTGVIKTIDRYLQNVVVIEEENRREEEVENAPVTTFNAKAGETPATVLPKLLRTYPEVVCVRELTDVETVELLLDQPAQDRKVVGGIAAADAAEALFRVLALKVSREKFAKEIKAVVSQRVVRILCENCKQPYAPPPQLLKQLGVPQGKIEALHRPGPPPVPPDANPEDGPFVCPACNGIGYVRRTAIFELLVVNDDIRKALMTTNKLDELRKAAAKTGHTSLMQEGVVAAARGLTSVQEVIRVLKG